jgi:hypothetical protein
VCCSLYELRARTLRSAHCFLRRGLSVTATTQRRMVGWLMNWKWLEMNRSCPVRGTIPAFVCRGWAKRWNTSVVIVGFPVEIRTEHPPNSATLVCVVWLLCKLSLYTGDVYRRARAAWQHKFGMHEEESVNRSQMAIKCRTCDLRTWKKKHLCLGICSTNIDTLVPSLYQCVETCSIEVFLDSCLSQFRNSVSTS